MFGMYPLEALCSHGNLKRIKENLYHDKSMYYCHILPLLRRINCYFHHISSTSTSDIMYLGVLPLFGSVLLRFSLFDVTEAEVSSIVS